MLGDRSRWVSKVTATFDGHHPVTFHLNNSSHGEAGQTITFPRTTFHTLRLTIDGTTNDTAPPLTASTPTQIYEAMLTGPEAMPVFNDLTITPQEKRDIIAYVTQVRAQPNPGGFSLGRVGPVTEGLVAFLGLLLFLVLAALWITAKHGKAHE